MSFFGIKQGLPFALYRYDDINQSDTIETVAGKSISKIAHLRLYKRRWSLEKLTAERADKGHARRECLGLFAD